MGEIWTADSTKKNEVLNCLNKKPEDIDPKTRADILKLLGKDVLKEKQKERLTLEFHTQLLTQMRESVGKINSDPEVIRNGFQYPIKWLDAYAQELEASPSSDFPDIGIIGYGSLQSPASFEHGEPPEVVRMEGVKRGLYISGFGRNKKYWDVAGIDPENHSAITAVKYDSEAHCNGLRLPFPSTFKQWEEIVAREDCYMMLPGPPVDLADGRTSSLNLICWPMGRNLINEMKPEIIPKIWKDPSQAPPVKIDFLTEYQKKIFIGLKTSEERRGYLKALHTLSDQNSVPLQEDQETLEEGVARSYNTRIDGLYSLDERPLPNMAYVHTCLNMGDGRVEEEFLDTTFCYNPKGEEITLREYLQKYAPKTNPKLRPGMNAVDGHSQADVLRTQDSV